MLFVNFFFKIANEKVFEELKQFYAETKGIKGLKQYNEEIRVFIDDLEDYLQDLKNVHLLETQLFDGKNDVVISNRIVKIPSHVLTYQMFEEGKTISEIAKEKGVMNETIFGHLAKFAEQGVLDIKRIVAKENIKTFETLFKKNPDFTTISEWKNALPKDFEFNEIRVLLNYFTFKDKRKE